MPGALGLHALPTAPAIPLPIGISFFTFQAISYLVDVYRREISPPAVTANSPPIIRCFRSSSPARSCAIARSSSEMQQRPIDRNVLTEGAYRFWLGLGKKMVIADNLGTVVDATFALPAAHLDAGHAWLGIFCYALQIYFDFSGYSDMAIGLGRLLGFHFRKISISPIAPRTSHRILAALAHDAVDAGSATTSTYPLGRQRAAAAPSSICGRSSSCAACGTVPA